MARKRKVGRPKGSKNISTIIEKAKEIMKADNAWELSEPNNDGKIIAKLEPIYTRLETAIIKFETAIDEAIAKLNRMV